MYLLLFHAVSQLWTHLDMLIEWKSLKKTHHLKMLRLMEIILVRSSCSRDRTKMSKLLRLTKKLVYLWASVKNFQKISNLLLKIRMLILLQSSLPKEVEKRSLSSQLPSNKISWKALAKSVEASTENPLTKALVEEVSNQRFQDLIQLLLQDSKIHRWHGLMQPKRRKWTLIKWNLQIQILQSPQHLRLVKSSQESKICKKMMINLSLTTSLIILEKMMIFFLKMLMLMRLLKILRLKRWDQVSRLKDLEILQI